MVIFTYTLLVRGQHMREGRREKGEGRDREKKKERKSERDRMAREGERKGVMGIEKTRVKSERLHLQLWIKETLNNLMQVAMAEEKENKKDRDGITERKTKEEEEKKGEEK